MSGPLCESCGYWSATNGPLCESCANDAYAARIAALKAENARLRRELAGYVEALVHYDEWFGDECRCGDSPCPVTLLRVRLAEWGQA